MSHTVIKRNVKDIKNWSCGTLDPLAQDCAIAADLPTKNNPKLMGWTKFIGWMRLAFDGYWRYNGTMVKETSQSHRFGSGKLEESELKCWLSSTDSSNVFPLSNKWVTLYLWRAMVRGASSGVDFISLEFSEGSVRHWTRQCFSGTYANNGWDLGSRKMGSVATILL